MAITKITADVIDTGTITADNLHATLDLSSKTVTLPTAQTATTQSAGDNSTKVATTAYVETATAALVDSAPGTLNTLNELAAALGDDANFSTTVTNNIATKAPIASPTFTGTVEIPNLTISSSQGTDGQVLTSTGSGIGWEDVPAGGVDGIVSSADATAITIDSSEKVGIGTSSPGRDMVLKSEGSTNGFRIESNDENLHFLGAGASSGTGADDGYYAQYSQGTLKTQIWANGDNYFNGGNVGIGTSSPATDLAIVKSTSPTLRVERSGASQLDLIASTASTGCVIDAQSGKLTIRTSTTKQIEFETNDTERMRITSAGNVGIGQTSPDTTLHIGDGASHYVRIENAGSGDVASGYQIYRGASTMGMQLYDNPADDATTLLAQGSLNFIANGSGIDIKVLDNGSINFHGTGTANKSFEVQDRQSGYSSFWVDDNNRDYGRGITNAYGLLGGTSTQYDGDGATYPVYGFGGAADNHSSEALDFWIKSTTTEWQPMVFFAIASSTANTLTGQTAGWALIRATHYNNTVSTSILDSGGGGTFSLSVIGSLDGSDYMKVRVAYSGGQNRCNISVWCSTYQHIRGVTR